MKRRQCGGQCSNSIKFKTIPDRPSRKRELESKNKTVQQKSATISECKARNNDEQLESWCKL